MDDPLGNPATERPLDDPRYTELATLIRRSFRVRENHTPVYVDVSDNLARVSLDQHQILFGRRGSGKSCLLVYFRRVVAKGKNVLAISINGDTVKTLDYPDVLIRLLLAMFEGLPVRRRWGFRRRRSSAVQGMMTNCEDFFRCRAYQPCR